VSSRGVLNYTGFADLRAPLGAWGTLLLDPSNITLSNGTQTTEAGLTATTDDSVINAGTLVAALGSANVVVSTGLKGSPGTQAGNITLAVSLTWSSDSNLTLQAAGQITLNGAVTATAGGLTLQAGSSSTISANQAISVGRFELLSGNWVQNTGTLPSFAATDFRLTGGSFLRAAGGDGSTTTPYSLTDIYGVQGMGSSPALLASSYQLANDIAAAGTSGWNDGAGFVPVGTDAARFTGSLDGAGNVITGLRINRPTMDYVGLIGYAGSGSSISNLGLVGGSVTGSARVGGLAGANAGTIRQAYVTGAVTGISFSVGGLVGRTDSGSLITQSYATGQVEGEYNVGGLVGYNPVNSLITRSYATGAVTGQDDLGGLVGANPGGNLTQSYATGAVYAVSGTGFNVGGLVGYKDCGNITQAYATGAVTGTTSVGGLVGQNRAGSIEQAYASGAVSGSTNVGGLVGWQAGGSITQSYWDRDTTGRPAGVGLGSSTGATGLTTAEARSQTNYAGWDFTDMGFWYQAGDMRPILRSEAATAVNGVITIRNLNQLQLMNINLAGNYRLAGNIDASATNATENSPGIWGSGGFVPVGTDAARFTGRLDGAGNVITGLRIYRPSTDNVGLIGYADFGSSISNLGLVGG
ncbi:MAG: beta strand repeat-containing protein, partial [Acetobacteraceae bacterium]